MIPRRILMSIGMAVLLAAGTLSAQVERGTIAGTVRDPSGAVVPSVAITVKNVATGVEFKTATTQSGEYVAPNLIPGEYSVTASKQGFTRLDRSGLVLNVYERLAVDLTLQVGTVTQAVEVKGEAPLLESQATDVVTLVPERDVTELPLNGRTVFQLAPLVAGVTNGIAGQNANNTSIPDNARDAQGLSVNGLVQSTNSYILDGVYDDQINQGLMALIPPLEALQEFTLETSNFRPEMGRGGGVMNMVLKSGTNQFHGVAFDYLRNSALDARNFFDYTSPQRLPNYVQNQFGGTFGGPIRKGKTFFFADYQGFRQREGQSYETLLPDANLRNGDFQGTNFPIYDPATYDAATNTRQLFANQTINSTLFSPAAVKILNYLPLPNGPISAEGQGIFYSSASRQNNQYNYDIKIDHTISDRDSLSGHWSEGQSHTLLPGAFSALPQYAPAVGEAVTTSGAGGLTGRVSNPSINFGLSEIHNFSPRVVNEARVAFVRAGSNAEQLGYGHNYADQLGIPNTNVTNNNSGFPTMDIEFLSGIGETPYFPEDEVENVFQYLDNVTFIRGSHTFKAGADFKKVERQFTQILGDPAGGFTFGGAFTDDPANPGTTGNGVADFLLGIPASGDLIRNSGLAGLRSTEVSAYWQDTWRVTSNLTFDYGVRYDLFTPQTEVFNRQTNFDFATAQLLLPPGTLATDPNERNRALIRTDYYNFAPRLGFAYTPTPKTVIRSAFGVFYFPQAMEGDQMTLNPPFVGGTNYVNVSVPQQINQTLDQGFPTTNPFISIDQYTGSLSVYNPDKTTAYALQWNFGIQRQLSANTLLDVTYVGNKSTHLEDQWNPNQALPGNGSPLVHERFGDVGRLFSMVYMDFRGNENYNALEVSLKRRWATGFTFLTNYTWSHTLGCACGGTFGGNGGAQSPLNLDADYSNMTLDIPNRFVFSGLYELPFGHGKAWAHDTSGLANALIGGWQLNGVATIQSGAPFTVNGGAGFPNRVCNGNTPAGGHSVLQWFDPSCFPLPAPVPDLVNGGVYIPYGNAGANELYGPGYVDFDISLFKSFAIRENKRLEFRSEFFNAFNRPNFAAPSSSVPSATAGEIFSANPAREIQMVLRLIF